MDDEQMAIVDCQMGKTESYRYIVEKYKVRAFNAALLFTGNREDALDLSQEAFYKAFRAIKSFQSGKNFYTWFYKILKNLCLNHYKRIKSRRIVFSDMQDKIKSGWYVSQTDKPDEIFEENELREVLWRALKKLKAHDREILILKEFNELSYKEIAEILNIPIGSVMSRLFYARQKIAKILEEAT
jgi:RNA polymerase sigma-70 factor (ECF subfamily)